MTQKPDTPPDAVPAAPKALSPAAKRALEEARSRREALEAREVDLARVQEKGGRGGKDPVRYEDWEVKGIASDF